MLWGCRETTNLLGGAIRANHRSDGDEQKRVIASSSPCRAIGRSEERIDLGACEEVGGTPLKPLARNREDALDQSGVLGFFEGRIAEEGPNGGEPDVAAPRRVAAFVLDVEPS